MTKNEQFIYKNEQFTTFLYFTSYNKVIWKKIADKTQKYKLIVKEKCISSKKYAFKRLNYDENP